MLWKPINFWSFRFSKIFEVFVFQSFSERELKFTFKTLVKFILKLPTKTFFQLTPFKAEEISKIFWIQMNVKLKKRNHNLVICHKHNKNGEKWQKSYCAVKQGKMRRNEKKIYYHPSLLLCRLNCVLRNAV